MNSINKQLIKNILGFFTLISVLILTAFAFTQIDIKLKNDLSSKSTLDRVVTGFNAKLEHDIKSFGYRNFELFKKTTHLSRFFDFFDDSKKYLTEIHAELSDIQASEGIFSKVIMYRTSDNMAITGIDGYKIISSSEAASSPFFDIPEILEKFQENFDWPFAFYSQSEQCLVYAYPIINYNYFYNKLDRFSGFVCMYATLDYLLGSAVDELNADMTLLLLDCNNRVFFSQGNNILSSEVILNEVLANLTEGSGKYRKKIATNTYDFYWDNTSPYDITFIYYSQNTVISPVDSNYLKENIYLPVSSIFLSVISVALFAVITIKERKYQKRFLPLPNYGTQIPHSAAADSFAQKFKIMIDLLYGNISSEDFKPLASFMFGYKDILPGYAVLLVMFDDSYMGNSNSYYKENISQRFQTILSDYFESESVNSLCIIHPSVNLSCLLNLDTDYNMLKLSETLMKLLTVDSDIGFNILYSPVLADSHEISEKYRFLRAQTRYSYIFNYYNVFSYDDLKSFESKPAIIPDDYMSNMTKLLNSGNIEALKQFISQTGSSIKSTPHSYRFSQNFIMSTLHLISKSFKEQNISSGDFVNSLQPAFEKSDNLDRQIDFIMQCLDEYKSSSLRYSSIIGQKYLCNIVNYIEANIPTVSLADISKNFNISQAHFSRVFKDTMDINFSDYVSRKKLEKATRLLIDGSLPIAEIAKSLGYDAPAYFSKKFKEQYGLTPMLYRKRYKAEEDAATHPETINDQLIVP